MLSLVRSQRAFGVAQGVLNARGNGKACVAPGEQRRRMRGAEVLEGRRAFDKLARPAPEGVRCARFAAQRAAESHMKAGDIGPEHAQRSTEPRVHEGVIHVQRLGGAVDGEHRAEVDPGVWGDEIDAAGDCEIEIGGEVRVQLGVLGPQWLPGEVGEVRVVPRRSVEPRFRIELVERPDVEGVERVQVEEGVEVFAAACFVVEQRACLGNEAAGVEREVAAAREPHEGHMGAEFEDAGEFV